ncbi:hypothetical protein ACFQ0G_10440 [Streptomyces chiangmaiensis]
MTTAPPALLTGADAEATGRVGALLREPLRSGSHSPVASTPHCCWRSR